MANKFGKTRSGKTWHLLDKDGTTRCDKTPTKSWLLQDDLQYPDTEHLCRQCLEPRSAFKESQVMQIRSQARQGLEALPTMPREWRNQAITNPQEMFLLRNGMNRRDLLGLSRAGAAEHIHRIKGSIYE